MASEDGEENPWSRPGFLGAGVVVLAVVILGSVLGINSLLDNGDPAQADEPNSGPSTPAAPPTPTPAGSPSAGAGSASICGLDPGPGDWAQTLDRAPEAAWAYQGTIAYPSSPEFGPAATQADSYRYCFQRSPQGALFAAANAYAQGYDPVTAEQWLEYFVADGEDRETAIESLAESSDEAVGQRFRISGFRVLEYDGTRATVDLAIAAVSDGQMTMLSRVYHLVWQDGDWKLAYTDATRPVDEATITDFTGYVNWGD